MFAWLFGDKKSEEKSKEVVEKKQKKEQNKWVQQALLQFLMSKQWRITLLNFVDNNCMVFDNEEQNKFQYTSIHNKFKSLVAGLFDSVMNDLGIDSKTLVSEIAKGLQSKNKKVFEQLLYVQDFLMFKGMMLKRNVDLEKQALKALGGGKQLKNKSKVVFGQNTGGKAQRSDNDIMKQILKISKMEEDERRKKQQKIKENQARIIEQSERQFQRALEQSKRLKQIQEKMMQKKMKQKQNQELIKKQQLKQQQDVQKQKQSKVSKQQLMQKKLQMLRQKKEQLELNKRNSAIKLLKQQENKKENISIKEPVSYPNHNQQILQEISSNKQQQIINNLGPTKQQIQQRKQKLAEYREMMRKKKTQERHEEMQSSNNNKTQSILFAEGGVIEHSNTAVSYGDLQTKIPQSEIQRRKQLMKRIKNKITEEY